MTNIIPILIFISAPLFLITTIIITYLLIDERRQFESRKSTYISHLIQLKQNMSDEKSRLELECQTLILNRDNELQIIRETARQNQFQLEHQFNNHLAQIQSDYQTQISLKEQALEREQEMAAKIQLQLKQRCAEQIDKLKSNHRTQISLKEQALQREQEMAAKIQLQLKQRYSKQKEDLQRLKKEQSLTKKQFNEYNSRIESLKRDAIKHLRMKWIESLSDTTYRNEIEVEIKFVHPLLQYLGYCETDIQLRVPIVIQVGRQPKTGYADWLINRSNGEKIIVEAKAQSQAINDQVQAQAQSYAFAVRASHYILTNGSIIQIYLRGISTDEQLLSCHIKNLADHWEVIEKTVGNTRAK